MLKLLSKTLRNLADTIDGGNCEMSEKEVMEVFEHLNVIQDRNSHLSKQEACRFLQISRATFDRYVASGKIAKGKKRIGFTELSWSKSYLKSIREQLITHDDKA